MNAETTPTRRGRREFHSGDMDVGQKSDIYIPPEGPVVREQESIVAVEGAFDMSLAEALKFMEEPVTIRLEHSSEKFAPKVLDFTVNGVTEWVPVGQPVTLKRKYVEVIARCKPDDISTYTGSTDDENPQNRIQRFTRAKHPFTVIQDANPRGFDWLTKVMQEA